MSETYCVKHIDQIATGYCSICNKPFCTQCLELENNQPICSNCKDLRAKAAAAEAIKSSVNPMGGGSTLNFKGKGLDDDPLGLFGGASPSPMPKMDKTAAPPLATTPSPTVPMDPPPAVQAKPVPPVPAFSGPMPMNLDELTASPTPLKPIPSQAAKPSLDLDTMIHEPQPMRPPFPKAPPVSAGSQASAPPPFPIALDENVAAKKKIKVFSIAKVWLKYLFRRSYEVFDPLAKKIKVPTYVFLALVALLAVGIVLGVGTFLNQPSVALADSIQPIHMVQVNSGQISEMDITAYTEFQGQLQKMGFTPLIQMTIPQLPSPNFFDVGSKDDAGTYCEILKMPGQITPHLSFVSVFTNGVWFSTNAWTGDNQSLDYLISEFYPTDTIDQLYVQHVQTLEKLKQDKGWQVQTMSENRYMAAISDHLRWFLAKKDIQGYQADFKIWH